MKHLLLVSLILAACGTDEKSEPAATKPVWTAEQSKSLTLVCVSQVLDRGVTNNDAINMYCSCATTIISDRFTVEQVKAAPEAVGQQITADGSKQACKDQTTAKFGSWE